MDDKFTMPKGVEVALEKVTATGAPRLGSYNSRGDYVIAPAIIKELLSVNKYKKTTFKNSVFCTSFLPVYGELTFEVVYEKNSINNSALATIYLLENEYKVNGYLQNTIKTKIGHYIGDLDGFIEESYKRFNISILPVGESKDYRVSDDEKLDGYIVTKQQFNNLLEKVSKEECDQIYEDYFTKRLEILNSLNSAFSKEVLAKFKNEYAKIEKYFLKEKDYRALSELLDKCFEDVSGTKLEYKEEEEEFQKKILPILTLFIQEMEKATEKASNKAKNLLNKKERAKLEDIVKQEEEASPSKSNIGVDKSPLVALLKGDMPKVLNPRGTSSEKVKTSDDLYNRLNKALKGIEGLNKIDDITRNIPPSTKVEKPTQENPNGKRLVKEFEEYTNKESQNNNPQTFIVGDDKSNSILFSENEFNKITPNNEVEKISKRPDNTKLQIENEIGELFGGLSNDEVEVRDEPKTSPGPMTPRSSHRDTNVNER